MAGRAGQLRLLIVLLFLLFTAAFTLLLAPVIKGLGAFIAPGLGAFFAALILRRKSPRLPLDEGIRLALLMTLSLCVIVGTGLTLLIAVVIASYGEQPYWDALRQYVIEMPGMAADDPVLLVPLLVSAFLCFLSVFAGLFVANRLLPAEEAE
ncbi:hypothetical protein IQ24_03611 [Paracoccus sulfuroxidans]|uniref:Uncharacterized protein n=1 Tax=Paracoccus sulfuroxidans TaxID=384678 RepID=A0A562NBC7_9RHOB|nr:hypothetical protein IQ24_03611 [Paracoccus sulfuroxidans]